MVENELIENKEFRNKMINKVEVLDKVGKLLLMPGTEFMNVDQVAEYYKVGSEAIKSICKDHEDELSKDGFCIIKQRDFLKVLEGLLEKTNSQRGKITAVLKDGQVLVIPNRGLRIFPKRAILRIGMLLRDSEVAREIRTQLLNIEEKVSEEIKVEDSEEQKRLAIACADAYASGDVERIMKAHAEYVAYQNRHIKEIEDSLNQFFNTDGLLEVNEAAKVLEIGEYTLFSFLRKKDILYKNKQKINLPYERFRKSKCFVVKEKEGYSKKSGTFYYPMTYITPKGMDYIRKLLNKSKEAAVNA